MPSPNKSLKKWLAEATPDQTKRLAKEAGTSVAQLRHIAHGRRAASASLAQRIAHASQYDYGNLGASPLPMDQRELCDACALCPLATRAATR